MSRRTAAALAGLVGFAVLVVLVLVHPGPLPLDRTLHRWALEHREPVIGAAAVISSLGTLPVLLPLLLLAGVVAARRTGCWWAVVLGPAMLFAGQAVRFCCMVVIDRPRPPVPDWARPVTGKSFPSGHTTTSALGYCLLLLLLAPSVRNAARRALLAAGLVAAAALVGVSRVVLGVHWPTDVFGGWSLALLLLPLGIMLVERLGLGGPFEAGLGKGGPFEAGLGKGGPFERVGSCPDPMPADPTSSAPSASPAASRRTRSDPF